jgi:agmatinase
LDVSQIGIHTTAALEADLGSPQAMIRRVKHAVLEYVRSGRVVGVLGGEHSISIGAVQAHLVAHPDLAVLYLDAHTDLRDSYMGTSWGHASGARRIHEMCPLVLVGVRSLSSEERDYLRDSNSSAEGPALSAFFWPPRDENSFFREVVDRLNGPVYVSLDLDVLDPSVMPAVGTPEPGGMSWQQVTDLLRKVADSRRIVGFDVCELAPREGPMACSYIAAKLVYKLVAYATSSRPN